MPRKASKHPDRVAAHKQQKERKRVADLAMHGAQLAAVIDRVSPLPGRQSHFRDALRAADDPLALSQLQLRAEQQIRAIDQVIGVLVETHRDKTLLDVALHVKQEPLQALVVAGLIRRVIELSELRELPRQAAEIRHADTRAARKWVLREWLERAGDFNGASHFASIYVSKVKAKFGFDIGEHAIRTRWIKDHR